MSGLKIVGAAALAYVGVRLGVWAYCAVTESRRHAPVNFVVPMSRQRSDQTVAAMRQLWDLLPNGEVKVTESYKGDPHLRMVETIANGQVRQRHVHRITDDMTDQEMQDARFMEGAEAIAFTPDFFRS